MVCPYEQIFFVCVTLPLPVANVVMVGDLVPSPVCLSAKTGDTVCERFYADTGANRSIHPNIKSAVNFYRKSIDISTASGYKSMQSEGVGKMLLYTPTGIPMPGFSDVIFTKQTTEKLASVGELCDNGLVCVFDKNKLTTFHADNFKVKGAKLTQDQRDPKSKLYPLSLFRKVGERETDNLVDSKREEDKTIDRLPESVTLEEGNLPISLLAKTYIKPGLSDLDRFHAKFGDVGIKYIKRSIPSLKIPKKYRCEFCVEGKIHKFGGHHSAPAGVRVEYAPGVCLHTDHSGPYARSISGARYSQLYLDRGSGYLWAVRQKKKTDHYDDTPHIFLDSRALSGKRTQILQTDGDGVFSGGRTAEMLEKFKVRHEWSAPYDSNTNSFIELLCSDREPLQIFGERQNVTKCLLSMFCLLSKEKTEILSLEKTY